ncbi:MAG: hypothetical protein C4344_03070, partial [Acidimicrobiia bacterium]
MGTEAHPVSEWLALRYVAPGDDGRLRATFVPDPARHQGAPGFLHGGVAATVLDEVMGALGYVLDQRPSVTATLTLRYRRPVRLDGTALTVEAWREAHSGPRRRHRVHGRLLFASGEPAVEAHGIFVDAPAAM